MTSVLTNTPLNSSINSILHKQIFMYYHPIISCFSKIQNGLSFWYRPTKVVLEKAVKRLCVCVCVCVCVLSNHLLEGLDFSEQTFV